MLDDEFGDFNSDDPFERARAHANAKGGSMENWLNPLNKLLFVKAFKNKANTCIIRDGRTFKLSYEQKTMYGELKDVVHITSISGPSALFLMERVLDETWLGQE